MSSIDQIIPEGSSVARRQQGVKTKEKELNEKKREIGIFVSKSSIAELKIVQRYNIKT